MIDPKTTETNQSPTATSATAYLVLVQLRIGASPKFEHTLYRVFVDDEVAGEQVGRVITDWVQSDEFPIKTQRGVVWFGRMSKVAYYGTRILSNPAPVPVPRPAFYYAPNSCGVLLSEDYAGYGTFLKLVTDPRTDPIWTTGTLERIPLSKLSDEHLENLSRMLKRHGSTLDTGPRTVQEDYNWVWAQWVAYEQARRASLSGLRR